MAEYAFKLTPVSEALPEPLLCISRPLLFFVAGQPYVGRYHTNGWFYCDEAEPRSLGMAAGPNAISRRELSEFPDATHWAYLRPEDE